VNAWQTRHALGGQPVPVPLMGRPASEPKRRLFLASSQRPIMFLMFGFTSKRLGKRHHSIDDPWLRHVPRLVGYDDRIQSPRLPARSVSEHRPSCQLRSRDVVSMAILFWNFGVRPAIPRRAIFTQGGSGGGSGPSGLKPLWPARAPASDTTCRRLPPSSVCRRCAEF